MRCKKLTAAVLTAAMTLTVFLAPLSGLKAQASPNVAVNWNTAKVYTTNLTEDNPLPSIRMQTPQDTIKLYAGMTWEQLEMNMGARLNVSDAQCGPSALSAFQNIAASYGGSVVKTLDMDFELYLGGWTNDITALSSPVRVEIGLPAGCDLTKDYAVISVRQDGALEVLGDLDVDPALLTVDTASFNTFAIISGTKGAFAATTVASPHALDAVWVPNYPKSLGSTIPSDTSCAYVYAIATVTDAATVNSIVNGGSPTIEITDVQPGTAAQAVLQAAAINSGARWFSYQEIYLKNRSGRITQTGQKIRVTMTVPYNFPAYADYAVAVLNADGSVSVLKDIDANENTITIDTDQFRTYAIMWGAKGAFALLP